MKTFKDLKFKFQANIIGRRAELSFRNGYGVSVIYYGTYARCDDNTYELAVLLHGEICYDTEITSDVLEYITEEEISKVMLKLQELPEGEI